MDLYDNDFCCAELYDKHFRCMEVNPVFFRLSQIGVFVLEAVFGSLKKIFLTDIFISF